MKRYQVHISTLVLLLIAACRSGTVESSPSADLSADRSVARYTPIAKSARAEAAISALTGEEQRRYKDALSDARGSVMDAYYTGATTAEIDVLVEKAIASQVDNPYLYQLVQTTSGLALELWLQEEAPPVEAVARHTQRLLEYEYPDVRALVPALEALRGTWSPERLRAAAAQVQQQARKPVLGKQCEGCTAPALERAQTQEQRDAVRAWDEAQAAALDRLAQARF